MGFDKIYTLDLGVVRLIQDHVFNCFTSSSLKRVIITNTISSESKVSVLLIHIVQMRCTLSHFSEMRMKYISIWPVLLEEPYHVFFGQHC